MKVFNGKAAAEDYMSTHSLAYSTPDLTLKKFAYWLGDLVDQECKIEAAKCPNEDGLHPKHRLPRLMAYVQSKDIPYTVDKEDVDETAFRPTGAVTGWFQPTLHPGKEDQTSEGKAAEAEVAARFCFECGAKVSEGARFCPKCGTEQKAAG